ncbi:conjugal transfer protein TraC [Arthrobacter pigmenti]
MSQKRQRRIRAAASKVFGLGSGFTSGSPVVLDVDGRGRSRAKTRRELAASAARAAESDDEADDGFPAPAFAAKGEARANNLRGRFRPKQRPFSETAFSAATAYPFLSGANLGDAGVYIGEDIFGGGAFVFDPWELYNAGFITGMSMVLIGALGTGKSTCAKSTVVRLCQLGRKALILADRKGEWDEPVRFVGGRTIKVGPGQPDRINPLDEGIKPLYTPEGDVMSDQRWQAIVRARRLNVLKTMAATLLGKAVEGAEHTALTMALDRVVAGAAGSNRVPILPEFTAELRALSSTESSVSGQVRESAERLMHGFDRCDEGDLAGMFDGPTTVQFDPDLPMISVNTSALGGASPEARKIAYACTGSWAESMITNSNSGQRLCVYEEGWDSVSDEASLARMMEAWKLARDYGIFNILIMHKLADLDIAGDAGSAMSGMARSLLGDTEVKVIYRQETANLDVTQKELGLTDAERDEINRVPKGTGLWLVGSRSVCVKNNLTGPERPVFDTDKNMDVVAS